MTRAIALAAIVVAGCASFRNVTAADGDFADYASFRVAEHEGTRLARAQVYVEAHPEGAWIDEVRGAFEREEPAYFDAAKASRAKTSDYLASLPRGPHAAQAFALLTAFDAKVEDVETARLLREARRTEAMLERSSKQRKEVSERVLGDVAALLDPGVYGARLDDLPSSLRRVLGGRRTWGPIPPRREEDLFFPLPTHLERESRVLTVAVAVTLGGNGRVIESRVEGSDLFVRWCEADTMTSLDPTNAADRATAAEHARELLAGAAEARLPAARCDVPPGGEAVFERACDGWTLIAIQAKTAGGVDAVIVRGPTPGK